MIIGLVLLVVLCIALYAATAARKQPVMQPVAQEQLPANTVTPVTQPSVKAHIEKNTQAYTLSFFKPNLEQFPDSVISEENIEGNTYFAASFNKYNAENGSYIVGGAVEIYSPQGVLIASCLPNNQTDFCKLLRSSQSGKIVFSSTNSLNSKQDIDIYHILK